MSLMIRGRHINCHVVHVSLGKGRVGTCETIIQYLPWIIIVIIILVKLTPSDVCLTSVKGGQIQGPSAFLEFFCGPMTL